MTRPYSDAVACVDTGTDNAGTHHTRSDRGEARIVFPVCRCLWSGSRRDHKLGQTTTMSSDHAGLWAIIDALLANPVHTSEVRKLVPAAPGLYAWWAAPTTLPELDGPAHPTVPDTRLLYVGLATKLRSRIASNHLRHSGSSTLRRTLAGLLLDEQGYRTRWTDRVVLVEEDETRLTTWMGNNLLVSWCEHSTPSDVESEIIRTLRPPLNVDHSTGPTVDIIKAARRHYTDSAGPPKR